MTTANVFDIKRFAIHDGAGIRTTIFIKGCPLECKWCQNPEGLEPKIRLYYSKNLCIGCKSCFAACKNGAVSWNEGDGRPTLLWQECKLCKSCVAACPTGALRPDAAEMTVDEVMAEIEKDRVFYGTDGGVTLSGGECTASPQFSLEVLRRCREAGIDTAVETCFYTPADTAAEFVSAANHIIADIKLINGKRHEQCTGRDNALILENIRMAAKMGARLLIRTPLIPGFTADEENICGIGEFVLSLTGNVKFQLLNYNSVCREKYDAMRLRYAVEKEKKPFSAAELNNFKNILTSLGLDVLE